MNSKELSERMWDFAARLGKLVDALPDTRLGRHVASQLLRCGTAPAPNYDEGRAAESKADFIHKMGVVLKELVETSGWLRFVVKTSLLTQRKVASLLDEAEQLEKIIASSRLTAQANPRKSPINNLQSTISNHGFLGLDLKAWLAKNGPGLHHFCFKVDDVAQAHAELPQGGLPVAPRIHQGTQGKRAFFLDRTATQGVQVEVTGK